MAQRREDEKLAKQMKKNLRGGIVSVTKKYVLVKDSNNHLLPPSQQTSPNFKRLST